MNPRDELVKFAHIESDLYDSDVARLVISSNRILEDNNSIPGLDVNARETSDGIDVTLRVMKNIRIEKPIHLCFGVLDHKAVQTIKMNATVEEGAKVILYGHCVFPNATDVKHIMQANIDVHDNAEYNYFERHVHSDEGGVEVYPNAKVRVGNNAKFRTEFDLVTGRVGFIAIDYEAVAGDDAVVHMQSSISALGKDIIKINERTILVGERARGVLRSRVAVRDSAMADVYNKIIATGAYARGHVECTEILQGDGMVKAYPEVEVLHPKARVTHEANLGGIDNRQLETLMARGLSEREAENLIILGLLS